MYEFNFSRYIKSLRFLLSEDFGYSLYIVIYSNVFDDVKHAFNAKKGEMRVCESKRSVNFKMGIKALFCIQIVEA